MIKKNIIIMAVGGLVVMGLVFYGGMKFGGQNQITTKSRTAFSGQFNSQGTGMPGPGSQNEGAFRGGMNGGIIGEVIAKDDKSITVKLKDGGSKIVFYSEKTLVSKTSTTSLNDVLVGGQVVVIGSSGQDGSVSAESIQLRN